MRVLLALLLLLLLSRPVAAQSCFGCAGSGFSLNSSSAPPPSGFACKDLIDNDGDGIADYPGDAGCSSPTDISESGDANIYITAAVTSDTDLENAIAAAGGGSGPVTVCGATGTTCGTMRALTGAVHFTRPNVTLAYFNFDAAGFAFCGDGQRWFNNTITSTDVDDGGFDASGGTFENFDDSSLCGGAGAVDDWVIDNSYIDGGTKPGNYCYETQIILYDTNRGRFTNNTVTRLCDGFVGDHSEGLYFQDSSFDVLVMGNTFIRNGSTAHMFFTCYTLGGGCNGSHRICVKDNSFTKLWNNGVYQLQHQQVNGGADTATFYIDQTTEKQRKDMVVDATCSTCDTTHIQVSAATAPIVDNAYDGYEIVFAGAGCGSNNGIARGIHNYVASTRTFQARTDHGESWATPTSGCSFYARVATDFGAGGGDCRQCLDGLDNDADGLEDLWDPQCVNGSDNSEGS